MQIYLCVSSYLAFLNDYFLRFCTQLCAKLQKLFEIRKSFAHKHVDLLLISLHTSIIFTTLVIEIGMQNAAQAITIACSPLIFNNEIIAIPAIIYALMMNLILLAYVGITKIRK